MLILGVDPGLASVGYGVVHYEKNRFHPLEFGTLVTAPDLALEQRLLRIHRHFEALIARHHVDSMAVEELFFTKNVSNGIQVGHGRGVVLLAGALAGIPVFEYTPMQVKQAITGYGRAEKHQVQYMVRAILGLREAPRPDDTADALALCVCHAHNAGSKLQNLK